MAFETYNMRGILKFPKFTKPYSFDNASNQFIEDWKSGEFGCLLVLPIQQANTETERLLKIKNNFLQELKESKKYPENMEINDKNYPFDQELDKDKKSTGNIQFKFKRACKNKAGQDSRINFCDAKRQVLSQEELEQINSGSEIICNYTVYTWDKKTKNTKTKEEYVDFGISLCLLNIQIIKAVKKSQNFDCFEVIDDGYDSTLDAIPATEVNNYDDDDLTEQDLIGDDEIPF